MGMILAYAIGALAKSNIVDVLARSTRKYLGYFEVKYCCRKVANMIR